MNKETSVFHTFFTRLVDYAGLFPPAKLPLQEALVNYRSYLDTPDSRILSRFIITASRLSELSNELLSQYSAVKPLSLSLITRDPIEDLPMVSSFISQQEGRVIVGSLEIPIAADLLASNDELVNKLSQYQIAIDQLESNLPVFYELLRNKEYGDQQWKNWSAQLPKFIEAIASHVSSGNSFVGFKLRCGGVEAEMVPSSEHVTGALLECAAKKVRIKFTAGLHHPFRHDSAKLGVKMHGYFNLFFGAMLAFAHNVSFNELSKVIEADQATGDVVDTGETLSWLGHKLSYQEVKSFREDYVISYGSCSFVEPIEDAKSLGWLL